MIEKGNLTKKNSRNYETLLVDVLPSWALNYLGIVSGENVFTEEKDVKSHAEVFQQPESGHRGDMHPLTTCHVAQHIISSIWRNDFEVWFRNHIESGLETLVK